MGTSFRPDPLSGAYQMTFKKYSDLLLGGLLVLGCILLLSVLIPVGVHDPGQVDQAVLAPDFWIKIIVWGLLAVGVFILWHGYRASKRDDDEAPEADDQLPFPRNVISVLLVIVFLFVYQQSIEYLGVIATSIVAILLMTTFSGYRNWKAIIPVAALLPVGLYYFFLKVAHIPMPLGIFG